MINFLPGSGVQVPNYLLTVDTNLSPGSRAVDPHSFYVDMDPAVFLNADPDPGPGPA